MRDYLLAPSHPIGGPKAAFFMALGYTDANWPLLRDALLRIAHTGDATPARQSPFGRKFVVRAILWGPSGRKASVLTVWMVSNEQDFPHFVTAFPR